ncbi:MAG: hypothetical protein MUO68_07785 [Desulfobacteraceae bacterium]|nr:hypothetical protein [Desulfobacteraceae bacterium]
MGNTQLGVGLFVLIIGIILIIFLISKRYSRLHKKRDSKTKKVELKSIYGEKQKKYIRTFKTKVVGVTFDNDDGSSRQNAIGNLQVGQQVYLVWNPHNPHSSNAFLVFGNISTNEVVMSSCLGHLKSGLGADVLEWRNDDNYEGIYAEVAKILGGTRNKPTFGCLIRICFY